jgi:hypothetical protein
VMRATIRLGAVLLLLQIVVAPSLRGQLSPAAWPRGPVVVLAPLSSQGPLAASTLPGPSRPDTYPSTYWKEGGIIGGILLGIAGALLVNGLCNDSDTAEEHCGTKAVGGAALGAGVGFAIGSLIGGQFHKGS